MSSLTGSSVARLHVAGTSQSSVRSLWEATDALVGDGNNGSVEIDDGGYGNISGPIVLGATAGSDGQVE